MGDSFFEVPTVRDTTPVSSASYCSSSADGNLWNGVRACSDYEGIVWVRRVTSGPVSLCLMGAQVAPRPRRASERLLGRTTMKLPDSHPECLTGTLRRLDVGKRGAVVDYGSPIYRSLIGRD